MPAIDVVRLLGISVMVAGAEETMTSAERNDELETPIDGAAEDAGSVLYAEVAQDSM